MTLYIPLKAEYGHYVEAFIASIYMHLQQSLEDNAFCLSIWCQVELLTVICGHFE